MPLEIDVAQGLDGDARDRAVLRGVVTNDRGSGVAPESFPAHVRPVLGILAHRGLLHDVGGQAYSITPPGSQRLADLDAAAEVLPPLDAE